jgi:hypothetical protein
VIYVHTNQHAYTALLVSLYLMHVSAQLTPPDFYAYHTLPYPNGNRPQSAPNLDAVLDSEIAVLRRFWSTHRHSLQYLRVSAARTINYGLPLYLRARKSHTHEHMATWSLNTRGTQKRSPPQLAPAARHFRAVCPPELSDRRRRVAG